MEDTSIKKGKELHQLLIKEALENANFKEQLVNDPKSAIESLTGAGMSVPDEKTLIVEDQTDQNTVYFNIPAKPDIDDYELCEDELEHVSGGTSILGVECAAIAVGIGVVVAVAQIAEWLGDGWNNHGDEN